VTANTVFIASKVKNAELWLPRFLVQLEQLELPDSKVAFMYGKSVDRTFSYLDHYRTISRHDVEIYADPYLPPEDRHGAMLTRIKQDIQKLLKQSECTHYLNIDCDVVDVPPQTVKQLLSHNKDVIASMVWTEGRPTPTFFDTYEFRLNGCRFHPLYPPGLEKTEPFQIDSVSTCYVATAEAELEGVYSNPYPHIPWSADLIKKGYEIWVDPLSKVHHIDLERLGIGRQPLPITLSMSPYITDKGVKYTPQQVGAQLWHLAVATHLEDLAKSSPLNLNLMKAFLGTRQLITASYKVFNSDDFLKESLESIYDYVDLIDIVEGAIEHRMCEGKGSTDDTIKIIKDFPDPKKKIRLIQGQFKDKQEIQHKLLEICRSKWMLFIDADEIVEGMDKVREFALKHKTGDMIYARPKQFFNFWHDFEHVIYSENPMSPWAEYGLPHPFLIHRDIPGLNFGSFHTIPTDGFANLIHSDSAPYQKRRAVLDDVKVYHFGNALSKPRMKRKLEFERERGIGWKVVDGKKEAVKKNFWFTKTLPEDMVLVDFDKNDLPPIMKTHPRFKDKPLIRAFKEDDGYKFEFV